MTRRHKHAMAGPSHHSEGERPLFLDSASLYIQAVVESPSYWTPIRSISAVFFF